DIEQVPGEAGDRLGHVDHLADFVLEEWQTLSQRSSANQRVFHVELGNQALEAAAELVEQADQAAGRKIREIGQVTKVSRRRHRGSAAVEDVRVAENQLHAGAWNSADSRAGLNRQRPHE